MLFETTIVGVAGFEPAASCSQSRRDNRATLHPESFMDRDSGAMVAESVRFELTRQLLVDSLANCSINHSGNSPFYELLQVFCGCKCMLSNTFLQTFFWFFSRHIYGHLPIGFVSELYQSCDFKILLILCPALQ